MHPSSGHVHPQADLHLLSPLPPSKSFCSQDTQVSSSSALRSPASVAGSLLLPWNAGRLKASTLPLPYHNIAFILPAINNIIFGVSLTSVTWISEQLIIFNHLKTRKEKKKKAHFWCHSQGYHLISTRRYLPLQFSKLFSDGTALTLGTKFVFVPEEQLGMQANEELPIYFAIPHCICKMYLCLEMWPFRAKWKTVPLQKKAYFIFIFIGQWRERNTSYRNYFPTHRAWKQ